uniref:Polypeptide N-acetylgalactosaminyltransferase n=1 Tax=Alexandrium monilatum TaxID=311494 RepID=A0A7S4SFD9_9DINO|mmetsp:Transcript_112232/g.351034  ORF Transcript_112232/g.351034 Transcript_112232/m.351034 type:complete len:653 (+) Transcript_112232:69-2027(+)
MAKGGGKGGVGCALRCALLCVVPLGAGVCGVVPGIVVSVLSLLSVLFEVALLAMRNQGGKGKSKRTLRPSGWFPLQLVGLYMLQLWCLMLHAASEEPLGGDAPPAFDPPPTGDGERPGIAADGAVGRSQLRGAAGATEAPSPVPLQPRAAGPGAGFQLDAPAEALRWKPRTISVVLPCAEEREYAVKTVRSVFEGTPKDVLHEIVVVDDGSEPPLSSTHLTPEVQRQYRVKMKRHAQTVGLIGAKQTGGDAATGDIVVFFDCHVAPQPGWHEDFLRLISENYRRMVVPRITALDVDAWAQVGSGGGLARCYLTWDADFKWASSDNMYIPVISGGLLGMSNRWWRETGGYDKEMLGWGGENLDQSLRVWLCGGEIVTAPKAEVAHMWRDGTAKTAVRYKRVGDTSRNRARAVYAWYGEFAEKLQHYPAFALRQQRGGGQPWYGNLSGFQEVKQRLQGCRSFAWFLRRFKDIYEDGGLLPNEVFQLREESTGKCLHYDGAAGTSFNGKGVASLQACNDKDHRQFWHLGNLDRRARACCSGLRAWNTDQCLGGADGNGKASTGVCAVAGEDWSQEWSLSDDGRLARGRQCLGPAAAGQDALAESTCLAFRSKGGARWTKQSANQPLETELYRRALREHPETFKALDAAGKSAARL